MKILPNIGSQQLKNALWNAFFASLLFSITYVFYNSEFVRANVEDIAFDIVNRLVITEQEQETKGGNVLVFGVDDLYMKNHQLYDKNNQSNYGYLFPRGHIANFIERLDKLVAQAEAANKPKALFIDYDMSFSMLPYGKALSEEDKKLTEVLKRPRGYVILLPKINDYHLFESSTDPIIQQAIKNRKIVFVSAPLLVSNDGIARRYQSEKVFKKEGEDTRYIGASIALWQLIQANQAAVEKAFSPKDVVANRIWYKTYKKTENSDDCIIQQSYWSQLIKYSAACSLFDIVEEDFSNSVILYGGTFSQNTDKFKILNIIKAQSLTGIDMHANSLMTILHLDGNMQRLSLWASLLIVFISFFVLELLANHFCRNLKAISNNTETVIVLALLTLFFILASAFLLLVFQLWFNWFLPIIIFELVKISFFAKDLFKKLWLKINTKWTTVRKTL